MQCRGSDTLSTMRLSFLAAPLIADSGVIGQLTKKFARNLADITTRQNIQLHWLTIADLSLQLLLSYLPPCL